MLRRAYSAPPSVTYRRKRVAAPVCGQRPLQQLKAAAAAGVPESTFRGCPAQEKTFIRHKGRGRCARTPALPKAKDGELTTLTTWLLRQEQEGHIDLDLFAVLTSIASACKQISNLVKMAPTAGMLGMVGAENASGDEQKKLDIVANDIFCAAVANSGRTAITVSEEEEKPISLETVAGKYICAFDPIDGSSNLDACISSGSIFAIYSPGECIIEEGDEPAAVLDKCLTNTKRAGTELVAAGYCMYSSSSILVLTVGKGVYGFSLDAFGGEFFLTHPDLKIPDPGQQIYSINEGNESFWDPSIKEYIAELKKPSDGSKPYSYRYIGALCPDFHRILIYGGIWLYPPDSNAPSGKARLLYEVAPMSFIAEQAGGVAFVGPLADQRVLEVVPQKIHQKSPLFAGSTSEVRKLQDFLKKRNKTMD